MAHLDRNGMHSHFQYGLLRNRSTELVFTHFTDAIRKQAENGNLTGHVFIDLSKAFDTISHAGSTEKVYKQWIFSEIAFIPP